MDVKTIPEDTFTQSFEKGNNTAKTRYDKFDHRQWGRVEQKIDNEFDLRVFKSMIELGSGKAADEIKLDYQKCGDDIYRDLIRKSLVKLKFVEPEEKKSNKKQKTPVKKMNKADQIREKNKLTKVSEKWTEIEASFNMKKLNPKFAFRSIYGETRLAGIMYCLKYMMKKKNSQMEKYELIVGTMKAINNLEKDSEISKLALNDLSDMVEQLKEKVNFTYKTLFTTYPKFVLTTGYDKIFPRISVNPYKSQIELINHLKVNEMCLILYIATIGNGKTTTSLAICEFVKNLRAIQHASGSKNENTQLLFVCSVEPVRLQVCKIAFTNEIPFGIGVIDKGVVRIINNYNCAKDKKPLLIVSDIDSAISLLKESQDYILFLDEPTVGADVPNHQVTDAVAELLEYAPARTILCSATLPFEEEIPEIVKQFKNKHSKAVVKTVHSLESIIGCEIRSFTGYNITPHNNCETIEHLKYVIQQLNTKPFVGKMYTAPILYMMWDRMMEEGLNVINLEDHFSNFANLSQSNIQEMTKTLLQMLVDTNNNDIIKRVCKPLGNIMINEGIDNDNNDDNNNDNDESNSDDDGPTVIWGKKSKPIELKYQGITMENIFTKDAHKFLGACLVVVKDPARFAFNNSREFHKDLKSASKMIKHLESLETKYNESIERLEYIKNDMERTQKEQEIERPRMEFLPEYRVNTEYHIGKYTPKEYHSTINRDNLQTFISLETIPRDLICPDWAMLLLYSGIGIYEQNNQMFGQNYTDLVLQMASLGQLAFLITDINISYGANYPFCHLLVEDEVLRGRSINTIFQLFGRVGRVGKSWVGFIHVGDETAQRLMDYIQGKVGTGTSEEAKNLNLAVTKRQHIKTKEEQQKIIEIKQVEPAIKQPTRTHSADTITLGKLIKNISSTPPKNTPPVIPEPTKGPVKTKYVPPFRRNDNKPRKESNK